MKVVIVAGQTSFEHEASGGASFVEESHALFGQISDEVYVQCPSDVIHLAESFVPNKYILTEPSARGTALAVGLAAMQLSKIDPDTQVLFAFANQRVSYRDRLIATITTASALHANLHKPILIGVSITQQTEAYGYIEVGKSLQEVNGVIAFEMRSFTRLPDKSKVVEWSNSWNYLWDTGYMIATPAELLGLFRSYCEPVYRLINDSPDKRDYHKLPKLSLALGLYEQIPPSAVAVVPVDLGVQHEQ